MRRPRRSTPLNSTEVYDVLSGLAVGTPIRVSWIDAHHVSTAWVDIDGVPSDTCPVTSVAMFVKVTDEQLFYAADLAWSKEDPHLNALSAVPLGCINKVEILGDPHG